MGIKYIEEQLNIILNNIKVFSIEDIYYKIGHLFSLINLKCDYIHIEEVEITEVVASTWVFVEQLLADKNRECIKEIYTFMIDGFMNFLRSERYFNQNAIRAIQEYNSCEKIKLISEISNIYINSCLVSLIRLYLGLDFKEINDFESELIKHMLVENHYKKYDNIKINIPINNIKYYSI